MTNDTRQYIKEVAQELAFASHQSRDKEVSGLFVEIKRDITNLEKTLIGIDFTLKQISETMHHQDKLINSNESRIDELERNHSAFKTVVATLGTIAGIVWTGVTFFFNK